MTPDERYTQAFEFYKAKKFDEALEILYDLQKRYPDVKEAFLLEADVWRELKNPVKAFRANEKILPFLKFTTSDEKKLACNCLIHLGINCMELSLPEEAIKFFRLSAQFEEDKRNAFLAIDRALFTANCIENFSIDEFRELYSEYNKYLSRAVSDIYPRKFYSHEKIRIGFISSDFNEHAVVMFAWHLLAELDKNFFAVYFYSNLDKKLYDELTEQLRKKCNAWRDISPLTDEQAAKQIHDDEIDILVDLGGHTAGGRLSVVAYRPAAVQISGIGYENSTGLDCVDYFLSDVYCARNVDYFTEKIIRMPHSHVCFTPEIKYNPDPADEPPCIRNGFVTFGSFNNFRKVTDSILQAWKKILDAVSNSRLLLKATIFDTQDGKNFVSDRLKNFGFDLSRIEMRGRTSTHPLDYNDMDIALDTYPYTGCVTTCEALWMGVPVVSLYGNSVNSRMSLSILSNVDIAELATDSYDEYVNRAVALAGDWELLTILRKNLRGMMKKSPLMDAENYVRTIEKIFVKILDIERNR